MKTLIIYLSATGKTSRLAKEIADRLEDSDLLPIELKTIIPKSEFWLNLKFGFLMSCNWGFRYNVPEVNISQYDQFIIGTPVWMGRAAPPLLSVIDKLGIGDNIAGTFITCGGGPGHVFDDICDRTNKQSFENHLVLAEKDSYEDPLIQDRINGFVKALKVPETVDTQSLVYEG